MRRFFFTINNKSYQITYIEHKGKYVSYIDGKKIYLTQTEIDELTLTIGLMNTKF